MRYYRAKIVPFLESHDYLLPTHGQGDSLLGLSKDPPRTRVMVGNGLELTIPKARIHGVGREFFYIDCTFMLSSLGL
jgi:hypothetical protein